MKRSSICPRFNKAAGQNHESIQGHKNITQTLTLNLLKNPPHNKTSHMCTKGHVLKVLRLLWCNSCRTVFAEMMWYSSAPRSENWAISFRISFSSQTWQHVSLETKLMEHLTMSCSDKCRWREINPFQSVCRIKIFYSSLRDFSSTAITWGRAVG